MGYDTVTELPGNKAHKEQLDAIRTRYEWASAYCKTKDVLEIACGSGMGIGFLGENANSVIGSDVDENLLNIGREHYKGDQYQFLSFDACDMPLQDNSVDVIICFEATYYFHSMEKFLAEVKRVLRPHGFFLCSSVNCQWPGFNPSPYSRKYHSVDEISHVLKESGFQSSFYMAFEDDPDSFRRRLISGLRRLAVRFNLVPKTMRGKEALKRLFYGELQPLPLEVTRGHGTFYPMKPLKSVTKLGNYKFYYFESQVIQS